MKYRRLGNSGLRVSVIGLGTNNFGTADKPPFHLRQNEASAIIDRALDVGINMIDTADVYGAGKSEEFIGVALKGKRDKAVIATKVYSPMGSGPNDKGSSRVHIMQQVEQSLRRLQTDYIDLYQLHDWDTDTPIEETVRAMDDLVRQGKARYAGTSNYAAWQLCEAIWTARSHHMNTMVSAQPAYSMLNRGIEKELIPFCDAYGVGILPYFPLANGLLTGKYKRGQAPPKGSRLEANDRGLLTDKNFDIIEGLERFAQQRGHKLLELAFAWLLSRPSVSSVIAGATKPEQVTSNAASAEWELTPEDLAEIDAILG
ncbi:MAG: aldo/keto reductase [SAR202 cluster bacterium]|nr:aldo/keto reductase [SAR202 cluster bacterium]